MLERVSVMRLFVASNILPAVVVNLVELTMPSEMHFKGLRPTLQQLSVVKL